MKLLPCVNQKKTRVIPEHKYLTNVLINDEERGRPNECCRLIKEERKQAKKVAEQAAPNKKINEGINVFTSSVLFVRMIFSFLRPVIFVCSRFTMPKREVCNRKFCAGFCPFCGAMASWVEHTEDQVKLQTESESDTK